MDLKTYNQMQIKAMEIHKWIESEKAGHDLGEAANIDWVRRFAKQFSEEHPLDGDEEMPETD